MSDAHDYSTLKWVRSELNETIDQARRALESFVEGSGETDAILQCIERIHQVSGTLRMLRIHGAEMLSEEMEAVATAMADGSVRAQHEASEALMIGMVRLPEYLEQIEDGSPDIPLVLLPQLNELRASRDVALLSEVALFAPDLDQLLSTRSDHGAPNSRLGELVREHRSRFHKALLDWFRRGDSSNGLGEIGRVLEAIETTAGSPRVAAFFRAGRAFTEGLREGSIETGNATRQLLGRFDRELRRIMAGGEQTLIDLPPNELLKSVLYYIAGARSSGPLIVETREAYGLIPIPTAASALEGSAQGFGRPSRELMNSVRSAIGPDLLSIKDGLDLFIRTGEGDLSRLHDLEPLMRRLADTLGMVGQGELRQRLKRQADLIRECVESGDFPDEQVLMSMAADIVYVEVSLDNLAGPRQRSSGAPSPMAGLPEGEFEKLLGSVISEAAVDITHCKDAITTFIAAPDNPTVLVDVPSHIHAVSGAFRLTGLDEAAGLLDRLGGYVSGDLLEGGAVPSDQALNDFADALTSIEYFMEAIREGRGIQESMLAVAKASLDSLTDSHAVASVDGLQIAGSEEEVLEAVDHAESAEVSREPEAETSEETDNIDHEILEIFIEEARDQLSTIAETLPQWIGHTDDRDSLATLRRSFHTLKGSGRMVGAANIGEFSWSIENMLNGVIEATIPISPEVLDILGETPPLLTHLVDCQAEGRMPELDFEPVMNRAFSVAGSDEATSTGADEAAATATPVEEDSAQVETSTAPINIDPELAEVFESEVRSYLDTLRGFAHACRSGSRACLFDDAVIRAFHTLRGSANLAEVTPIAQVSTAMESYANELKARGLEADESALGLLESSLAAVDGVLSSINRPGAVLPDWQPLVTQIEQRTAVLDTGEIEDVAEPSAATPVQEEERAEEHQKLDGDPELIDIFVEESQDLFEKVERGFQTWQSDPADTTPLSGLQRMLHTLKGAARFANITAIGDLSHGFESLISEVEKGARKPGAELMQLAQVVIDRMAEQIADVGKGDEVRVADDLLSEMSTVGMVAAEAAAKPKKRGKKPAPVKPVDELALALETPVEKAAEKPAPRVQSEQVRVRSDLLDRLVNNAGEVSIYRARLEQQNSELGHNLSELEQTVNRLRQQLRQLEIETETQILFRYERDQEQARELDKRFDPLELDRFSVMQQISRSLIETVSDLASITGFMDEQQRSTDTLLQQQARVATDLQDGLLRTRMVQFSQLVPRLHRLVRQTCKALDKKAELEVWGAAGELDKRILDRILGPLEHLLRNAVSHGIENPGRRVKAGKPESGTISLAVSREGTEVVLDIADDGAGIPVATVRRRAIEKGLLDPNAEIRDADVMRFILEHGFSTADEITQISGRGVGLDVVVSEVKQIGGSVDLASEEGAGTRFQIRLPLTLAITDALLIKLSEEVYAIPHTALEGVIRVGRDELERCYAGEQETIAYAGVEYDLHYLGTLLNTGQLMLAEQQKWFPLLLVHAGNHRVALQIDELVGNRQIVVKPVGPQLGTISWLSGGTILGDGRVALIVDLTALIRLGTASARTLEERRAVPQGPIGGVRTVMVVDDSITVRKVTGHVLERHGMQVITAKDGVEALAKLQDQRPDIMLLDIEMPRMDGYELARHMRNAKELADIPIIMITSRTGDKHRKLALDLGVKRYLGKPYQESELLDNIYSVLAESE